MRIDGYDLNGLVRTIVRLERPVKPLEIEIEAYPFGFDVDEMLPFPQPPVTGVRKRNGEVLRDAQGQPLIVRDENDADYRREKDRVFWLRMAAFFYYAVRPCGQIHFEAKGDPQKDSQTFFTEIVKEIKAFGITPGEVERVNEKARAISGFGEPDAEAAERAFFPEASAPTEG